MKRAVVDAGPKAIRVWVENKYICLRLEDERKDRFPAARNKRLKFATLPQLEKMELICGGTGIHWPALDEDLSIAGILEGRFGQG